ncbi:hypothetical protein UP09_15405 [Bradyrhizobium sp. LTSP885]|uniref:VWD domain-containing protein n=1 Tax=Bradyrhizobium sp. LTSP885 TaxID=1619232 RepID=UPI0005CB5977|nr:VWD domain-containing protein [Bradyrhizobium sp. LTSP885]KJC45001.1 hypothetical protein UP09_15405 [Bradyrhizobium sp. LTSP885]
MTQSCNSVPSKFGERWRLAPYLVALCVAIPLAASHAQTPQPPAERPRPPAERPAAPPERVRPTEEQRRTYEERMSATHPNKPGCFEAHFPDEQWVETKCLPPPRNPNPKHVGARPNTVGDGTDWFATVTSGNISQVTGSFDNVSGVVDLLGPIGGDTSVVHPNAYAMQMNSNTFTPSVCGSLTNCAWVQFIFSQTQCGSTPCVFIEYWLLNHNSSCPSTPAGSPAWSFYNGSVPNTVPGCFLNVPAQNSSAVPLSDLGSLRVVGKTGGGNDTVTASDSSGTLSSVSNPSISNLESGWTGVEYNLVGDCCSTETFFTSTTTASLTLRVATVNGTTNAPNCASTFTGTTAESNNLNLTGGCKATGGANPAIVFTESGGGALPAGVSVGDPHLTTFHGAHYNFQHSGEFILAQADPDFQVQVRQILITPPTQPAIAVNTGAAVKMGADKFVVTVDGTEVNGAPRAIEDGNSIELAGDVTVVHRGSVYTISRPIGDIVHVDVQGNHVDITVQIGATNASSTRGLLVGNPADEAHLLVGRDNKPIKGPVTKLALDNFIESWRVETNESLFSEKGRPTPSGAVAALTTEQLDKAKAEQARKTCVERGVKETTALDDCILDVAVMGKPELADAFVFAPKPKQVIQSR